MIAIVVLIGFVFTHAEVDAYSGDIEDKDSDIENWSDLKLWYRQQANLWTEALPIGNGRLGAMVFGRIYKERIQLNEETIWSGGPYLPSKPVEGPKAIPEIQRLIFEGKYRQAQQLFYRANLTKPQRHQKYQTLGNLWLTFPGHGDVTEYGRELSDYRRELDLDTAIVRVTYRIKDVKFIREVFASPIDQIIVVRLTADKPGHISLTARISGVRNSRRPGDEYFMDEGIKPDTLVLRGRNASSGGIKGQVEYQARVKAIAEGGQITVHDNSLIVTRADAVTLLIPAATNFVNYKDVSADPETRIKKYLADIRGKTYDQMRRDHVAEHQRLFRRVKLDLAKTEFSKLPTDERIRRFSEASDPHLIALYFQFGRYLLISSSRPGSQPPNLTGIWNESLNPAWGGKYTSNINLQMNYWPTQVCNLNECFEPFVRMVSELSETGRRTARLHYGAKGWIHHFNTDIWRATAPMGWGGYFGTWHTAGAWFCWRLWEHYLFYGDKKYLKDIYSLLKGSSQFFLETLVEHPKYNWLVTSPSSSPENYYKTEVNSSPRQMGNISICAGSAIDMQILHALFDSCIQASEILGVDKEFSSKLRKTLRRLAPMQIGKHGQIQEWLEDWDDPDDKHRHLSQLWGLYPGSLITPRKTPKLAEAAKQSLILRGEGGPNWAMAWKINLWARLLDG